MLSDSFEVTRIGSALIKGKCNRSFKNFCRIWLLRCEAIQSGLMRHAFWGKENLENQNIHSGGLQHCLPLKAIWQEVMILNTLCLFHHYLHEGCTFPLMLIFEYSQELMNMYPYVTYMGRGRLTGQEDYITRSIISELKLHDWCNTLSWWALIVLY